MRTHRAMLLALAVGVAAATTLPAQRASAAAAKSAADQRKQLETNRAIAVAASATLADLGDDPAPIDLPEARKPAWAQQSAFFLGASSKLGALAGDADDLLGEAEPNVEAMVAMNLQFQSLRESTRLESRRFETVANGAKARHRIAMNAIRHLRG